MKAMSNKEVVKSAMDQILEVGRSTRPTLPLNTFSTEYLPMLMDESLPREEIIGRWLAVSKHPYNEVDILNDDGTVAYVVPPIWIRLSIRDTGKHKYSVNELMARSRAKFSVSPRLGEAYLRMKLPEFSDLDSPNIKHIKMWNDIITNYGYPPIPIIEEDYSESTSEEETLSYGYTRM